MKKFLVISVIILLAIGVVLCLLMCWHKGGNDGKRNGVRYVNEARARHGSEENSFADVDNIKSFSDVKSSSYYLLDFENIKSEAEGGSPIAQKDLARIYSLCMFYSSRPKVQLAEIDDLAKYANGSTIELRNVKERLKRRCDNVDGGQRIPYNAYPLWLNEAARRGNVSAKIELRVQSVAPLSVNEAVDLADIVQKSRDPEAMYQLSNLMGISVSEDIPEKYSGLMGSALAGHAWAVAACQSGLDCERGSIIMDSVCITTGLCDYRNYEEFIRAQAIVSADQAKFDEDVRKIKVLR
ncbi:hypothetical protein [Xanthomonas sp. GPE 39]|uniref:hypothetical protein n=1 Tax=Xanthomonas sp. GPE 39 TaxID=1583099 RepID=UPI000A930E58|nr:hypothetical protein [Xanthomonas sp. GPE 39]